MRHAWVLAALLSVPGVLTAQPPAGVLHVTATLMDPAQAAIPVPRHVLLISDNQATAEPIRVLTRSDGSVEVKLKPGSYTVESEASVNFLGKGYQWTEMVDVRAGQDTVLRLTAENAEVVAVTVPSATAADANSSTSDPSLLFTKWQESVVAVWSPIARASGFVVDTRGLIATNRTALADASVVEVQLTATHKVPGRVLFSDAANDTAIVWVHPGAVSGRAAVPLECPPPVSTSTGEEERIVTVTSPLHGPRDSSEGVVTGHAPRTLETDLRLSMDEAGGPVFNAAGTVIGFTSVREDADPRRPATIVVIRGGLLCDALAAADARTAGAAPPEATRLPVEPTPVTTGRPAASDGARPASNDQQPPASMATPAISSSDFDVTFITPAAIQRARQRPDWTGGAGARSAEAEARIGALTEFGAWSDYFRDAPPVLVVRVTPKLVEGFWKRLGREAARTQGANLPAFKDFKTDFVRMRVSCGETEVVPIHPFVLEHRLTEKNVVREGLYVFDPGALGPQCGAVTLTLHSEKSPDRGDAVAVTPKVIEQLWQELASYRATAK